VESRRDVAGGTLHADADRRVGVQVDANRPGGVQRNREWERAYATARTSLLAGEDYEFPYGAYWMCRFAGVRVVTGP
jgi:hypothetical protein